MNWEELSFKLTLKNMKILGREDSKELEDSESFKDSEDFEDSKDSKYA